MEAKNQKPKTTKKRLKKCIKKLRFFYDVMAVTDLLDDVEDRKKMVRLLQELNNLKKEAV